MVISLQSDSNGLEGYPASEIDFILISTLSPKLIAISNWLKFISCPSSTDSETQTYLPVTESLSLFLTGVSYWFQLEKLAVVVCPFVSKGICSILEVFPLDETYLYWILNWTISCGKVSSLSFASGIAQKPLTLYFALISAIPWSVLILWIWFTIEV